MARRKKPQNSQDVVAELLDSDPAINVSIRMPVSLYWRFKRHCQDCNMGFSAFGRAALTSAMDQGLGLPKEEADGLVETP